MNMISLFLVVHILRDFELVHPVIVLLFYANVCILVFYFCLYALSLCLFVVLFKIYLHMTWLFTYRLHPVIVLLFYDNFCILIRHFCLYALSICLFVFLC